MIWNSAGWVATTLTQLPLKLISHWLHWTLCSWCFISFIINNDRNVLIERKTMFMIFTNILLRSILISSPFLWTPWGDTAEGSFQRFPHSWLKNLQINKPKPHYSFQGTQGTTELPECLANSPSSLKILIMCCTHYWPCSIKKMLLQG